MNAIEVHYVQKTLISILVKVKCFVLPSVISVTILMLKGEYEIIISFDDMSQKCSDDSQQ